MPSQEQINILTDQKGGKKGLYTVLKQSYVGLFFYPFFFGYLGLRSRNNVVNELDQSAMSLQLIKLKLEIFENFQSALYIMSFIFLLLKMKTCLGHDDSQNKVVNIG